MVAKQGFVPFVLAAVTRLSAVLLVAAETGWGQWTVTDEAKLIASDEATDDCFGSSVSLSGDTVVVGAWGDNGDAGSAYVFVRSGASWTEQTKLTSSDPGVDEVFGSHVSLSGDTVVIGSPGDSVQLNASAGSAFVFVRSGTNWTQQAKLTLGNPDGNDHFGDSVSLSGDTVVIGAYGEDNENGFEAGSAHVFVHTGTSWSKEAKLVASDGQSADFFGGCVSLSGDTLVVGAGADDDGGDESGSAYVFVRSGTTWTELAKLTAGDAEDHDFFGSNLSLSGDTVVVGAAYDDHAGALDAGSAYVFVRNGTTWTEQAKLTAGDAAADDHFGSSVSLSGDTVVVGAQRDDLDATNAGSAYVFVRSGTTWTEQAKLTASDSAVMDLFGSSVSFSGDTVVVGATWDDHEVSTNAGSAYVFRISPTVGYCTAGTSANGCQALLSATGTPSATAPSGFTLTAAAVEGQKDGLFFFGTNGQQANPWGNGSSYQCVIPPVVRTPTMAGVGTIGLCDGTFALDLNALWCPSCPKPGKNPGAGATVQAQLWYRDPLSTSNQTTSLSDAVEFGVGL